MIKCIAVDDEPLALLLIRQYAEKVEDLELTGTFDDAPSGLDYVKQNHIDLVIADIDMPELNGIQFAERLPTPKPMVVFTTAYREFAVEGFQLDAVDYLLKPFTFERFETAVRKVRQRMGLTPGKIPGFLTVRSQYSVLKIAYDDIEYIESMSDYVKIFLVGERHPVLSLNSLKLLESQLPSGQFCRVHRSFMVGLRHINAVRAKKVLLTSGAVIPVGKNYETFLHEWKDS